MSEPKQVSGNELQEEASPNIDPNLFMERFASFLQPGEKDGHDSRCASY